MQALLAAVLATIGAAAVAQQATSPSEVRVQASAVIKKQDGRTSAGIPIETAEVTMRVGYADLSLSTNSGQALLRDRVTDAAKDACARIASAYALGTPGTSDADCVSAAMRDAKSQVDAAIAAANARGVVAR
jgi:UrcA family protein